MKLRSLALTTVAALTSTERRIIFSVWDSGHEGVDRKKVADENRVQLLGKGEGVYSGDFGNEGTGGHSHLKYLWKTGEKQRFLVTALPTDTTHTDFSGYWYHPEQMKWVLISSWCAPKEGGRLRGLHGFSENFGGNNGHLQQGHFTETNGFAHPTANGSNLPLPNSATILRESRIALIASWGWSMENSF